MLLLVQLKSLGVMLKVKPSTVSQLPGVSLHSTVKLTPAVKLTSVIVGAGGGSGERETHDTSSSRYYLDDNRYITLISTHTRIGIPNIKVHVTIQTKV